MKETMTMAPFPIDGAGYAKKYTKAWPVCQNIKCMQSYPKRFFELKCNKHGECSGFSFTSGKAGPGNGCLKKCGEKEFGGYKNGGYDYWLKPKPVDRVGFKQKYVRKYPICHNILCGQTWHRATFERACDMRVKCSGFTFTNTLERSSNRGNGCLKDCGIQEFGGYIHGREDYWAKPAGFTLPPGPHNPNMWPKSMKRVKASSLTSKIKSGAVTKVIGAARAQLVRFDHPSARKGHTKAVLATAAASSSEESMLMPEMMHKQTQEDNSRAQAHWRSSVEHLSPPRQDGLGKPPAWFG